LKTIIPLLSSNHDTALSDASSWVFHPRFVDHNELAWVTTLTISAPKLTNSTMATNANAPKTLIASEVNCQGTRKGTFLKRTPLDRLRHSKTEHALHIG
jgi:hypothetical protein